MRGDRDLRGEQIIDSRDLQQRFDSLESDREALVDAVTDAKETLADATDDTSVLKDDEEEIDELKTTLKDAEEALKEWDEGDEGEEYRALKDLIEEASGYGDFKHGEALIRKDYFEEYAQQFAEDIGAMPDDCKWPCNHIDWKEAAAELEQDYSEFDFDGTAYLMRS
jgi:hypothetical protein